jgi:guanine deaminase
MSKDLSIERAFRGRMLHTPAANQLEHLPDALIVVGADGSIRSVGSMTDLEQRALALRHADQGTLVHLGDDQLLIPGMVDLHVHAPQWPQLGTALDRPLEEWLQAYTFPLEARYADVAFADRMYAALVDALLANGTTTALYFATIHVPATRRLAELCLTRGQRALIGRVAMDDPQQCPDYYRDESAERAVHDTREFIRYVHALSGNEAGLVKPVITPRFIPSCTDALLAGLGRLAIETGCHVQTHCSESDWEDRYVLDRMGKTDTEALEAFGLLSRRTVLAHGNFLRDSDADIVSRHGAAVAHCPLSNAYFSDAVFPVRHYLERGIHVGLGTDISGGASPSLLENARHAVVCSRLLESGVDPSLPRGNRGRGDSRIDATTAFGLATAGGGIALDLPIGVLHPGFQFDAIVLNVRAPGANLHIQSDDVPEAIVQKIIYHAGRADLSEVWVANRRVR